MCTELKKEITPKNNRKIYGWKVVSVSQVTKNDVKMESVFSYYEPFSWFAGKVHVPCRPSSKAKLKHLKERGFQRNFDLDDNDVFHFFALEKDARSFAKQRGSTSANQLKVIKVELRGRIFKGITQGMSQYEGLPALASTKAYWDGKFSKSLGW